MEFYALFYKYRATGAVGRHKEGECAEMLRAIARSEWDVHDGWYITDKYAKIVYSSQDEGE